jgi:hypothetical protein
MCHVPKVSSLGLTIAVLYRRASNSERVSVASWLDGEAHALRPSVITGGSTGSCSCSCGTTAGAAVTVASMGSALTASANVGSEY